jgi:putative ABC transport system permease protein
VQKLKSFFTLIGVMIGVMFLIAVVSIVEGMGRYMEDDFAGRLLGANTFTLRRYPWFGNNTTRAQWLEWQRRPRIYAADVAFIRSVLPNGTRWAIESPVASQRDDAVLTAARTSRSTRSTASISRSRNTTSRPAHDRAARV